MARVFSVTNEPPLVFTCAACPAGKRSLGALGHTCTECEGLGCTSSGPVLNSSLFVDAASYISTGDSFLLTVEAFNARTPVTRAQSTSFSQRVLLDLTPPYGGHVYDAKPCNTTGCEVEHSKDLDFMLDSDVIAAWWEGFEEAETAISHFEYCVGTTPLACDILPMERRAGGKASETMIPLDANTTHGDRRCVSVEAVNTAGLRSERVSSDCIVTDLTPPVTTIVRVGRNPHTHMDQESSGKVIFGSATAVEDASLIPAVRATGSIQTRESCPAWEPCSSAVRRAC